MALTMLRSCSIGLSVPYRSMLLCQRVRSPAALPRHSKKIITSSAATSHPFSAATSNQPIISADGDDYYSLLGLGPDATFQQIRAAYYQIIRTAHPDVNHGDESAELLQEFCAFLNEVYELLKDPETRAAYDDIAGFSETAVNPFHVTGILDKPEVFVDEVACIGCYNCTAVCPDTFAMEPEWGRARVQKQGADHVEDVEEAISTCPVSCISWVTTPQLALLEEAMREMERFDVWVGLAGHGHTINVFLEASIAWEKRRADQMHRRFEAQWRHWGPAMGAKIHAGPDSTVNGSSRADGQSNVKQKAASSAAAAARKWRDFQRKRRSVARRGLLLSEDATMSMSD